MATQGLAEISKATKDLNISVGSFRQLAANSNKDVAKIAKDLAKTISSQKKDLADIANALEDTSNELGQATNKQESTANAVRESVTVQNNMYGELRNISLMMKRLNDSFEKMASAGGVLSPQTNPMSGGGGGNIGPVAAGVGGAMLGAGATAGVLMSAPGKNVVQLQDGTVEERTGGTLSWRNNNPGNIRSGDFAKSQGAVGEAGGFAVFPTLEAGRSAKERLLFNPEGRYANLTIPQAISRYAPPSENDTQSYIQQIMAATKASPQTKLIDLSPEQRKAMLAAIEKREGFKEGKVSVIKQGTPAPDAVAAGQTPQQTPAGAQAEAVPINNRSAQSMMPSASVEGSSEKEGEPTGSQGGMQQGGGQVPKGDIVALGRYLQQQGLRVSEHPAFGGVRGKHSATGGHYDGRAIDVNFGHGVVEARDPVLGKKMDEIAKQLKDAGYNVLWRTPGHEDHLHASIGDGGSRIGEPGTMVGGMGMGGQRYGVGTGMPVGGNVLGLPMMPVNAPMGGMQQDPFSGGMMAGSMLGGMFGGGKGAAIGGLAGGLFSLIGAAISNSQKQATIEESEPVVSGEKIAPRIEQRPSPAVMMPPRAAGVLPSVQASATEEAVIRQTSARSSQEENAQMQQVGGNVGAEVQGNRFARGNDSNVLNSNEPWNVSVLRYYGLDTNIKSR